MKKIGFIDYFLDEWHANNYPAWIAARSGGEFEVAYAWGDIPSPHAGGRTNEQWAKDMNITLCGSIEEVIEKSDLLVVLSPDNPEQHLRLSELACKSGKPLYIDKTFAPDAEIASKIMKLAEDNNTPCWSSSALRFAYEYDALKKEGVCGQAIKRIQSFGGGEVGMYCIHQLEPIVSLMGTDAKRVISVGTAELPSVQVEFDGGRIAQVNLIDGAGFSMTIASDKGFRRVDVAGNFWDAFTDNLIEFFRTGNIPVPHEETITIAAIRAALLKSLAAPYTWIEI
ncbi:MAG: hypothetical protein HFE63_07395 [Clostridiales bacterium]|nr:hypothetical protein [Clostridiales bacterium]